MQIKDLNPGIRLLVGILNEAGFQTIDSGDGETHVYGCDREYGYISTLTDPAKLVAETHRLVAVLRRHGIQAVAMGEGAPPEGQCNIQAAYCPVDGLGIIDISYLHDRMIGPCLNCSEAPCRCCKVCDGQCRRQC